MFFVNPLLTPAKAPLNGFSASVCRFDTYLRHTQVI